MLTVPEAQPLGVRVALCVTVAVPQALGLGLSVPEAHRVGDREPVGEAVPEGEALTQPDALSVTVAHAVAERVGLRLAVEDTLPLVVSVGLRLAVVDTLSVPESVALTEGLPEGLCVWLPLAVNVSGTAYA
jgi:hypothetical protein